MAAPSRSLRLSPVDRAFRREVATFRVRDRRRTFPLGVHAGVPDGARSRFELPWPVPKAYDAGLRLDLAQALVDGLAPEWPGGAPAWAWLTRPGLPETHDCDLAWMAVLRHAFDAHGLPLAGFRAVTASGWLDVVSGESRTWKRLRV